MAGMTETHTHTDAFVMAYFVWAAFHFTQQCFGELCMLRSVVGEHAWMHIRVCVCVRVVV